MWKAVVGHDVSVKVEAQGDDWDTDPDFVVSVWCVAQRYCMGLHSPTVTHPDSLCLISIHQLRNKVSEEHEVIKKKELETGPKASYGYGGKFGTERDRMDKCAVGHEYIADVGKHSSQTDAAQGFGGKYGVQRDRADKSALGFEYKGEVEKHSSQKGKSMGTYYSKGFGGRYGVERDKVDKAAVGFDYKSQAEKHDSQKDYTKGFGGRYGVQKDRVDKSAAGFNEMAAPTSSYEKTTPLEAGASSGTSSLRSRFENMAKLAEEESRRQAEEDRVRPASVQSLGQVCGSWNRLQLEENFLSCSVGNGNGHCSGPHSKGLRVSSDFFSSRKSHRERRTTQRQPLPPCQQGEDEETPPTLPPRPADLGEELCKIPSQDQPIYSESLDTGGDYEELPEPSDYCDSTSGGADYEELPAPLEKLDAVYDHGGDGGETDNVYEVESPGTCAVALYDYQGDGDDEISFDPDDTITHIEMVDEGWWRGQCRGKVGLFPANYVKLLQ
ncbi:Hematopoietic lineage cell-specific protein [Nipponia nippon]|uniref:Hematopoietic lineage cell-specific protein n=1 Tax=Nipponia nippon TaxID=128390 RepID=A0A091VTS7_NIPNI|nr:Hematopoietic lineage cell-specific protein [Nipponia nippon]